MFEVMSDIAYLLSHFKSVEHSKNWPYWQPRKNKRKAKNKRLNQEFLNDNTKIDEWYINNTENIVAIKFNEQNIDEDEIKSRLK